MTRTRLAFLDPANRDRFWSLLESKVVVAYICDHTHNYSAVKIGDVWQLDAGHARGMGDDPPDPRARSTFILIHVDGPAVIYGTYRDDASGGTYTLMYSGVLTGTLLPAGSDARLVEEETP